MSEQIKPCPFCGDTHFSEMDMTFMHADGATKGKRIKCVTCGAQAPDGVWNIREADVALAAKEARIAELEGVLAKALAFTEANTFGGTDALALIEECHAALASKQQAEPAAHSEDGREVPEVVAELILGGIDGDELGDNDIVVHSNIVAGLQDRMVKDCDDVLAPLMTVAQHERIVAAKDEEISRLRESMMFACESLATITSSDGSGHADISVAALRLAGIQPVDREKLVDGWKANRAWSAQPARQVGGGETEAFIEWANKEYEITDGYELNLHNYDILENKKGWMARAALAPAAVDEIARVKNAAREIRDHLKKEVARLESDLEHAHKKVLVVMPEKKESRQFDPAGWNAALDEVARLNRRAIPAGLLERIQAHLEHDAVGAPSEAIASDLAEELRALLGKEGEK